MPHRLLRAVDGKRGDFLMVGGASYVGLGLSYVTVRTNTRTEAFSWLPGNLGADDLGWVWVLAGAFCGVAALLSRRLPNLASKAYAVLMFPPLAWAGVFLGAALSGVHPRGWLFAVTYLLISLWVWVVSDWPNPSKRRLDEPHTGAHEIVPLPRKEPHPRD